MERLTEICWRNFDPWECCGQDHYCQRGCHDDGGCANGCIVPKLYVRLAAYEDTGLTPEEAAELAKIVRCKDCRSNAGTTPLSAGPAFKTDKIFCTKLRCYIEENGFCSYGEKKGE